MPGIRHTHTVLVRTQKEQEAVINRFRGQSNSDRHKTQLKGDNTMGVVTYLDHTLGLALSPRLKQILKDFQSDKDLDKEDVQYLIDAAARYETLDRRISAKTYPLKDDMMDDEYEIKDILGDMIVELRHVYASHITDSKYFMKCNQFAGYSGRAIEHFSVHDIEGALLSAIKNVKDLQKQFDENGDDITVIGHFPSLKQQYGLEYTFNADVTFKDLHSAVIGHMKDYALKEKERLDDSLNKWDKVRL